MNGIEVAPTKTYVVVGGSKPGVSDPDDKSSSAYIEVKPHAEFEFV